MGAAGTRRYLKCSRMSFFRSSMKSSNRSSVQRAGISRNQMLFQVVLVFVGKPFFRQAYTILPPEPFSPMVSSMQLES